MRSIARSCLIAFLIAGLLNLPVLAAASESPVGTIIQSVSARLGTADAAIGTTVYPGDSLWTETGGTARLRVGSAQLYLLSASAATLARNSGTVQVTVTRGTVGFSTPASERLELLIPEGILRSADGQPAYGQVTLVGPNQVVISAYTGSLVLDNAGEIHNFGAGTSSRVTMLIDDAAQQPEGAGTEPQIKFVPQKRRHLIFAAILLTALGVGGYFLSQYIDESPSAPKR